MKEEKFEEIVEQYYRDIYKLVFLMVKEKNDAEDITQEVFLKAKTHLANFRGESSVKTWLYRIATNEVRRFFKKTEARKHIKVPVRAEKEDEDFEVLKYAMDRLDRESYEILFLKFFKEMSEKEIAFVLGIPVGTVKSRLYYAKKRLKEEMQKWTTGN